VQGRALVIEFSDAVAGYGPLSCLEQRFSEPRSTFLKICGDIKTDNIGESSYDPSG
jgi:hypothetical protein